jgi:hypothetical protein
MLNLFRETRPELLPAVAHHAPLRSLALLIRVFLSRALGGVVQSIPPPKVLDSGVLSRKAEAKRNDVADQFT